MSKATEGAYRKGEAAGRSGQLETTCPYPDHRTVGRNHTTYSRAFRRAWFDGWTHGVEQREAEAQQPKPPTPGIVFYVDELQTYGGQKSERLNGDWCHLWTDGTPEQLDEFAARIGLQKAWAQSRPSAFLGVFYHYDLRPSIQARALTAGAIFMRLSDYLRAFALAVHQEART